MEFVSSMLVSSMLKSPKVVETGSHGTALKTWEQYKSMLSKLLRIVWHHKISRLPLQHNCFYTLAWLSITISIRYHDSWTYEKELKFDYGREKCIIIWKFWTLVLSICHSIPHWNLLKCCFKAQAFDQCKNSVLNTWTDSVKARFDWALSLSWAPFCWDQ